MPLSRLGQQIAQVIPALHAAGLAFALIGGLALASHKVIRATRLASPGDDDPYRALDDLMAVVELMCGQWPRRNVPGPGDRFLL